MPLLKPWLSKDHAKALEAVSKTDKQVVFSEVLLQGERYSEAWKLALQRTEQQDVLEQIAADNTIKSYWRQEAAKKMMDQSKAQSILESIAHNPQASNSDRVSAAKLLNSPETAQEILADLVIPKTPEEKGYSYYALGVLADLYPDSKAFKDIIHKLGEELKATKSEEIANLLLKTYQQTKQDSAKAEIAAYNGTSYTRIQSHTESETVEDPNCNSVDDICSPTTTFTSWDEEVEEVFQV